MLFRTFVFRQINDEFVHELNTATKSFLLSQTLYLLAEMCVSLYARFALHHTAHSDTLEGFE